jgi:hypothetical protein
MGDRGNIVMVQHPHKGPKSFIYFYGHWSGHGMPLTLRKALKRGEGRWDDESYLGRIIFCELIGNAENLKETTGFGISAYITDNDYPLLIVDSEAQTVSASHPDRPAEPYKTVSFAEYVKLYGKALEMFRRENSTGDDE